MELKQIKPKPERKVKSRDKILNAALEVIALEGVDAITHRRVGKQSNLSNGVVSYHFPTREDLVNETFLFHLRQLEQLSEDITRLKPSEKVSDFIDATVEFVKRDQATPHLVRADYELILYALCPYRDKPRPCLRAGMYDPPGTGIERIPGQVTTCCFWLSKLKLQQ
jgi:AcrR family transcriptional regulator